jgi:SAM-dependent methyltransferase
MSTKPPPHDNIHDALSLDGDPDSVKDYYAKWAATYNDDVTSEYMGTELIAEILSDQFDADSSMNKATSIVADVGCGTGLVGKGLVKRGFGVIDGMDISPEMIVYARKLGIYRQLYDEVDINFPLNPGWINSYDAVICCGVFTLGHVQPEALDQLLTITRPGGLVVTSTRCAYYNATDYQAVSDRLISDGRAQLLTCLKDAAYTLDGDAHYWIYRVV